MGFWDQNKTWTIRGSSRFVSFQMSFQVLGSGSRFRDMACDDCPGKVFSIVGLQCIACGWIFSNQGVAQVQIVCRKTGFRQVEIPNIMLKTVRAPSTNIFLIYRTVKQDSLPAVCPPSLLHWYRMVGVVDRWRLSVCPPCTESQIRSCLRQVEVLFVQATFIESRFSTTCT